MLLGRVSGFSVSIIKSREFVCYPLLADGYLGRGEELTITTALGSDTIHPIYTNKIQSLNGYYNQYVLLEYKI